MQLWINNWAATLLQALPAASTTASVEPNAAARLTGLGDADYYAATLVGYDDRGLEVAWEIVRITGAAGGQISIERAREGTSAAAWPAGTRIEARLTAGALAALSARLAAVDQALAASAAQIADLQSRVEALESSADPADALTDSAGELLTDSAGNILTTGATA